MHLMSEKAVAFLHDYTNIHVSGLMHVRNPLLLHDILLHDIKVGIR
jgi:hypothetical protein